MPVEPFDLLGGKGQAHRPDLCQHAPDDGCLWCCERCNTDTHWCPGCGCIVDHRDGACLDCLDN